MTYWIFISQEIYRARRNYFSLHWLHCWASSQARITHLKNVGFEYALKICFLNDENKCRRCIKFYIHNGHCWDNIWWTGLDWITECIRCTRLNSKDHCCNLWEQRGERCHTVTLPDQLYFSFVFSMQHCTGHHYDGCKQQRSRNLYPLHLSSVICG